MQQYLELLKTIKEKGNIKTAAREGMPSTISLFGYQFRHNLADGFPLLTTKEINFKHIVIELLWFLKGDTNIKFLIDNGVNIWNEDAYNYYSKKCEEQKIERTLSFESFCQYIRDWKPEAVKRANKSEYSTLPENYTLGDCGFQYGKVWRNFGTYDDEATYKFDGIDQIKNLIEGLKNNPESRRHIVTSIDPANYNNLALYWCHCLMQFNCRPIPEYIRYGITEDEFNNLSSHTLASSGYRVDVVDNYPKYYLDCQMYQRSADVFLGVPYNIASYALLTEILAKICNMVAGEFIHTFGDVHIYENHIEAVNEQLSRNPKKLPKLNINTEFWKTENGECGEGLLDSQYFLSSLNDEKFIYCLLESEIQLIGYNPKPKIKAKLSTGLK